MQIGTKLGPYEILAPLGASVFAVAALPSPVTVVPGTPLVFPSGTLSFEVVTAP